MPYYVKLTGMTKSGEEAGRKCWEVEGSIDTTLGSTGDTKYQKVMTPLDARKLNSKNNIIITKLSEG